MEKKTQNQPKTTVFNLIILDESGSMSSLSHATISGCNETLAVAKNAAEKAGDERRFLASIYAFQSGGEPSRYIVRNAPVESVNPISEHDYRPCGMTPLYDAVGTTLAELEAIADTHEDASAIVTIITDGYENSSRRFTAEKVARMIDRLKEKGWTFNFIGANIDVTKVSASLNIDNALAFTASASGTSDMFSTLNANMSECYDNFAQEADMTMEQRIESRKARSKGFFKKK